ncbi:MAG: NADH-ubiquinone oxidoreductase-F iron-sulfur binding region domain-containing protein [Planctomycetales bacterium]
MELLRELTHLQESRGCLDDAALREVSARRGVPLYRLEGLVGFYPHFRRTPPPRVSVRICRDVACAMAGCASAMAQLRARLGMRDDVEIVEASCLGRCDAAPALTINDVPLAPRTLAELEHVVELIESPEKLPADEPTTTPRRWKCDPYAAGVTTDELRVTNSECGVRNAESPEHAAIPVEHSALRTPHTALPSSSLVARHSSLYGTVRSLVESGADVREACLAPLKAAGLRGMGGAGFPTGRKWELVAAEPAMPKYVICNADESEPGTFKDRVILEELPHLVIEGMLLAALTIGAERGIVFLRHEYTRERKALERALHDARTRGILGENAAGSGRAFDVENFVSPGGYILGEETALLEALEDRRGEPRIRPPYPGQRGLWGQPTLINNVETFALATSIVHRAALESDELRVTSAECGARNGESPQDVALPVPHSELRTPHSASPSLLLSSLVTRHLFKFVSVSGDVERPGVYEIPLGTPVRELIEMAGGMRDGRALKAFLPGGASSNFLTADHVDTPLDFDAMRQAGSMLGTGAVIVIGAGRDLYEIATNLVRFFRNESCGKCVPCRLGTQHAVALLEDVRAGHADAAQLATLVDLGATLEQTSICGLGQVAINPILSLLKHFPEAAPHG